MPSSRIASDVALGSFTSVMMGWTPVAFTIFDKLWRPNLVESQTAIVVVEAFTIARFTRDSIPAPGCAAIRQPAHAQRRPADARPASRPPQPRTSPAILPPESASFPPGVGTSVPITYAHSAPVRALSAASHCRSLRYNLISADRRVARAGHARVETNFCEHHFGILTDHCHSVFHCVLCW